MVRLMSLNSVYRLLEDRFRGDEKLILQRLDIYRPLLRKIVREYPAGSALDLGCGRGEWLTLCSSLGLTCLGIDQNEDMLVACREKGLSVIQQDLFKCLSEMPSESQVIVSAFHVIEHLDHSQIQTLIHEAHRLLLPGGFLILETPNYDNLHVSGRSFYLDPTHKTIINPDLVKLYLEVEGFGCSIEVFLQGLKQTQALEQPVSIRDIFYRAAYDVSIIGIKKDTGNLDQEIKSWIHASNCRSISELVEAYDEYFKESVNEISHLRQRIEALEGRSSKTIMRESLKKIRDRIARVAEHFKEK